MRQWKLIKNLDLFKVTIKNQISQNKKLKKRKGKNYEKSKTANWWKICDGDLYNRYHLPGEAFCQQANAIWWDEKSSRRFAGEGCTESRLSREGHFILWDSESWLGAGDQCQLQGFCQGFREGIQQRLSCKGCYRRHNEWWW